LTSLTIILFTRIAARTKIKGLPIDGPYSAKIYAFLCVAPHTKSKKLPISGPLLSKNLCFLHV
jgi:hypothetical protein